MANNIFVSARARAQEVNLLTKERLNRMVDCKNAQEALKILSEVNFGGGENISTVNDFEKLISNEKAKLFRFIKECFLDENFVKFFLLESDFLNAEAVIRSKYLKIDVKLLAGVEGEYSINYLSEKINTDDYSCFSDSLKKVLTYCDSLFVEKKATGYDIDIAFYKAYFNELYNFAKKDKFLLKIYQWKVDVANISTALRSRNFLLTKNSYILGGKISIDALRKVCEGTSEEIATAFCGTNYLNLVVDGLNNILEDKSISNFEKECFEYPIKLLKKEKYSTNGLMPFLQYCYYKLSDIENVRIILVGLINDMDKQYIKSQLRDGYEG